MVSLGFINYEDLRQQGIAWLEKLAGSEWTDFNAHDPGITILEQICYALTDLSYRIGYDIPDLLTAENRDAFESLFTVDRILPAKALTMLDVRKCLIDIDGINNAWIEPVATPDTPLYYLEHAMFDAEGNAITLTGREGATPLNVQGLYRICLESSPYRSDISQDDLFKRVAGRLHDQRSLAVDFDSLCFLSPQSIRIQAAVEIDPSAEPDTVYLAILEKLAGYLTPSVRFYSLEECLAQGKTIADIFDGPLLEHGFIDNLELTGLQRKRVLYGSDLIRVIMDAEGVRLVEYAAFFDGVSLNESVLELFEDKVPSLNINASTIILKKNQVPIRLAASELANRFVGNRQIKTRTTAISRYSLPPGRDRRVGNYFSILQQFPAIYGVGATGLPGSAGPQRHAQAKQLKAYLLLYDQLLANNFAQLAHIRDLFSFSYTEATRYVAAALDDPAMADIWREQNPEARHETMQALFDADSPTSSGQPDTAWRARNRFLDHLLARFAEQFADYSHYSLSGDAGMQVAANKSSLLRYYDKISAARGSGVNLLAPTDADNFSGLEKLLSLKLGLAGSEKLYVIENLLLRPIPDDKSLGDYPFLKDAFSTDPFSSLITVVLPNRPGILVNDPSNTYKLFAEQTVRAETPAHLKGIVCWLSDDNADYFDKAYQAWRQALRAYRHTVVDKIIGNLQNPAPASDDKMASIPVRDARDRLIDMIGLGKTYPLRDLPVPDPELTPYGNSATLVIKNSQAEVSYTFIDLDKKASTMQGNGGDLLFTTQSITTNQKFTIIATKLNTGLSLDLIDSPTVRVGLDLTLPATIKNADIFRAEAWITNYNSTVDIQIDNTQAGVNYRLAYLNMNEEPVFLSDNPVTGNGGSIVLSSVAMTEDVDIRIIAVNTSLAAKNEQKQDYLNVILALKVKANPDILFELNDKITYRGALSGLTIQKAQKGVSYEAFFMTIRDEDFIRLGSADRLITIPVPNKDDVRLRIPNSMENSNYAAAAVLGTGDDLAITFTSRLFEDSYVGLIARKTHTLKNGSQFSGLYVNTVGAVLLKPDTQRALTLTAKIDEPTQRLLPPIVVGGGEPGVFYEFTTLPKNEEDKAVVQGLPVYFYEQDDTQQNKGIEHMTIERDFVVAHTTGDGQSWSTLPDTQLSETAVLDVDDDLSIRAVKACTGVEAVFRTSVQIMISNSSS